ncbi:MAG: hypothetical protein K0Q73_963 [Paenibacillus sp.]|jgi:hypothetical protein|nr:hypothetical protein [Paenibacillus sp.]
MDNVIERLEQLTNDVLAKLDTIEWEDLEHFVEARDELICELNECIAAVPTEVQRERIRRILSHDKIIVHRMTFFKSEAEAQISKMSNAQKTRSAYNSYYSSESHFVDKKK